MNFFAETMFSHTKAESELEPFPHSNSDLSIGGIPCTNPFAPAALVAALCDGGDTVIPYFRRMTEVGNRGSVANRNTYRVLLGLNGDFQNTFDWEVFYSFGRTEDAQRGGGQINVANMREALNAIDLDANPLTTNDIVCANPVAVIEGCVPVNLFGRGSISAAAADWIAAPTQRQGALQQENMGATLSGPMFDAPGGQASFVIGAEWRREYSEDIPDALTQTGQNAGNKQEPTIGGYNVGEMFAEVEIPLISNAPFAEELSIGGAYRWSDYNLTGTTEAYTGRVIWAPTDFLRFRAQYARAVRVPNIGELFAPAGENFAAVADPCNGTSETDVAGDIDNNCRADPNILARINAEDLADDGLDNGTGNFTLQLFEIQGTGGFTGGGNTGLSPETAESYTLGMVLDQDFGAPGRVTVSLDWYQIEIEDIIRTLGRQETLNLCYNVPVASFPTTFCNNLVRDATGPAIQLGELEEVNTTFFNDTDPQEFSGIDLSVAWGFTMSDWIASVPGDVSIRMNATQLLYETEDGPGDTVGSLGSPEFKAQLGLVYMLGGWNFSWETNYTDDVVPSLTSGSQFNFSVGSYTTHDLRIAWDATERVNLYFGSNNVTDEPAPIILSGVPGNTTGTDTNAAIYDPIGRTFYAGVRLRY
jgi:outer membrane receptor protein involved in Fe transport